MAQNGLISPLAILDTINCYELPVFFKVEQINFDIQFWKQCCSVMHDWRNFNNVSFKSIMVILYDKGVTTVIHPGTWSQHPFVSGVCVFWNALYTRIRDSERSMINATTRERRLQRRFDYGYWNVFLLLGKVINAAFQTLWKLEIHTRIMTKIHSIQMQLTTFFISFHLFPQ